MNAPEPVFITHLANSLILTVYIQPRASKNEICGIQGTELKIRLTSPPVDGAANKLCREFVADFFEVPKSAVEIISGETSRHKRLRITGTYPGQFSTHISALAKALT
ncbi:MAG: YggU family protein [Proteobacteria bacterium]|nr:YggU family protein [Pseudomonadota bacterium]